MDARIVRLACCLVITAPRAHGQDDGPRTAAANTARRIVATETADAALPRGAVDRFGTTRFRPGRENLAIGILPDEPTAVITKADGRLQYFDLQTGRLTRQTRYSQSEVTAAVHTADGRYLAAMGDDFDRKQRRYIDWVTLVDAKTGEERLHHEFEDTLDVRLMAVADDASAIALIERDSIIIDLARGIEVPFQMDRVPYTSAVALSPDGKLLAVGSPGVVRVWNWRKDEKPRYFAIPGKDPRRRADIGAIRFSPDASHMAVSVHGEYVLLIDLEKGEEVRRFEVDLGNARRPNDFQHLVFTNGGQWLASPYSSTNGSGVAVWDVASGKLIKRLEPPEGGVGPIAFSSDGEWLAGIGYFRLCVWDFEKGEFLGEELPGHSAPAHTIRFLPGDEGLISASDDRTARLWQLGHAKPERIIKHQPELIDGRPRSLRGMDVSPDGKHVATSSMDDTVRLWELQTGREIYKWPGHGRVGYQRFVRFTPDGERLVSWGDDMRVRIWEIDTGKAVTEYRAQPSGEKLSPEGEVIDLMEQQQLFNASCGTISPDASRLAVAGKNVHVFDVASGRELFKCGWPKVTHVRQTAISPDNRYLLLLVWGYGEVIDLPGDRNWREVVSRAELRSLDDGALVAEVTRDDQSYGEGAAFSPDSRLVAFTVGIDPRSVAVKKVPDLSDVARIEGFDVAPFCLEFSHTGRLLAVSDEDTSVVVYDLEKLGAGSESR
jgi:WD40 repeat protein